MNLIRFISSSVRGHHASQNIAGAPNRPPLAQGQRPWRRGAARQHEATLHLWGEALATRLAALAVWAYLVGDPAGETPGKLIGAPAADHWYAVGSGSRVAARARVSPGAYTCTRRELLSWASELAACVPACLTALVLGKSETCSLLKRLGWHTMLLSGFWVVSLRMVQGHHQFRDSCVGSR